MLALAGDSLKCQTLARVAGDRPKVSAWRSWKTWAVSCSGHEGNSEKIGFLLRNRVSPTGCLQPAFSFFCCLGSTDGAPQNSCSFPFMWSCCPNRRCFCVTGYGGISLAVEGPSKVDIQTEDLEDGTCKVSYFPTVPGVYIVSTKFADEHVPGRPGSLLPCPLVVGGLCDAPCGPLGCSQGPFCFSQGARLP